MTLKYLSSLSKYIVPWKKSHMDTFNLYLFISCTFKVIKVVFFSTFMKSWVQNVGKKFKKNFNGNGDVILGLIIHDMNILNNNWKKWINLSIVFKWGHIFLKNAVKQKQNLAIGRPRSTLYHRLIVSHMYHKSLFSM